MFFYCTFLPEGLVPTFLFQTFIVIELAAHGRWAKAENI